MTPGPTNPVLLQAKQFVDEHIAVLASEIIRLQDESALGEGRFRELVRILRPLAGNDAQSVADSMVKRAALERAASGGAADGSGAGATLQQRVQPWVLQCLGADSANDIPLRAHRYCEEAIELVQASGRTREEVLQIVEWVYQREPGELHQEVGGVMITLAALCLANDIDMHAEADRELARVWPLSDAIRAKQELKPKFGEGVRVSIFEEGLRYADQYMLEILESEAVPTDESRSCFVLPVPGTNGQVGSDIDAQLETAVSWLVRRGAATVHGSAGRALVQLATGDQG